MQSLSETEQVSALSDPVPLLCAQVSEVRALTVFSQGVVFSLGKPWSEVSHFELGERIVQQCLSQVELSMGQIAGMCIGEGMRHLDYEQVDHSDQLAGDTLLQETESCLFQAIEDVVVTVTVLGQLHEALEIFVDLIGCDYVRTLGHLIDPRVNDGVYLRGRWC